MKIKSQILSAGTIATAAILSSCGSMTHNDRPNILCITCEDISPYLGCYGDAVAQTPNLDSFAERSVRFTQMHTTIGVSAPSRFSLITGTYSSAMGANNMRTNGRDREMPDDVEGYDVVLPEGVKCFTEYLREAGYYCTNNDKTDYQFAAPLSAWDENGVKAHWKNRKEEQPFFAIHNIFVTHEGQIWERANQALTTSPNEVILPPYYPDNDTVRRDMAIMYSNVHEMDRQFKALYDELEAEGVLENTIVLFYSDNGGPLPRQKRQVYRSGTNVPFMISFPDGYDAGTVDERLAMFVDIPATILSLAGIEPPKYMHGKALFGKYAAKEDREYVYAARDRMDEQRDKQGAVMDKQFRYIKNYMPERAGYLPVNYRLQMPLMRNLVELYEKGELNAAQAKWFTAPRSEEEFYDEIADPHNINNLIHHPDYQNDINRLRTEYERWVNEENRLWLLPENEYRARMLPTGENEQLEIVEIVLDENEATLTCPNKGASIVYKVNDEDTWQLYSQPLKGLKTGDSIKATSTRVGYLNSEVQVFFIL